MNLPQIDGIDHINIYSKGQTALGRALSNFAKISIDTLDGKFQSVEGYWYWLGCDHERREELRKAHGFEAKKLGRELRAADWNNDGYFKLKICVAMVAKLLLHKTLYNAFKESALPFRHYYSYGTPVKITEPEDGKWIVETWEHLRKIMQ